MVVGLRVSNYLCLPDLLCFTIYHSQTQQEHFFWVWASCQLVTPSWRSWQASYEQILWNLKVKTPLRNSLLFHLLQNLSFPWAIIKAQHQTKPHRLASIGILRSFCDRLHLFRLPHLVFFYIVPWQAVEASAIATMRRCLKLSFWDEGRRV